MAALCRGAETWRPVDRLWFGTNGGAYVFDGKSLRNYNEADGLSNDNVNCILEDQQGRIWFATHHNGVCYLDGETFTAVTEADGVEGTEVWDLFMDRITELPSCGARPRRRCWPGCRRPGRC